MRLSRLSDAKSYARLWCALRVNPTSENPPEPTKSLAAVESLVINVIGMPGVNVLCNNQLVELVSSLQDVQASGSRKTGQ